MKPLEEIVSSLPEDERLLALAGLAFFSGFGILPTTTDIVLIVAGILLQRNLLNPTSTIVVCLITTLVAEILVFELGKYGGPKVLNSKIITAIIKKEKIENLKEKLKGSHSQVARMIRFTPALRPWILYTMAALGLERKAYYRIGLGILIFYVPIAILASKALTSIIPIKPEWVLYILIIFSLINVLIKRSRS